MSWGLIFERSIVPKVYFINSFEYTFSGENFILFTSGTESSNYRKEKKSTEILIVTASEFNKAFLKIN